MRRKKIAVIDLGNRPPADEGVGLHTIDFLKEKLIKENAHTAIDVDLVGAGTPKMDIAANL